MDSIAEKRLCISISLFSDVPGVVIVVMAGIEGNWELNEKGSIQAHPVAPSRLCPRLRKPRHVALASAATFYRFRLFSTL